MIPTDEFFDTGLTSILKVPSVAFANACEKANPVEPLVVTWARWLLLS